MANEQQRASLVTHCFSLRFILELAPYFVYLNVRKAPPEVV
jgi:hypothetical protein